MDFNKVAEKVTEDVKEFMEDPKNKFAVIGGAVGYVASEVHKGRNSVLGAIAGYLVGKKKEELDEQK